MTHPDHTPVLLLQLRAAGLPEPATEVRFHPKRRWRFDLAWPERMTACEIEGGQWTRGRHNRPAGYEADCEKYSTAAILGWRVIRVTPRMIEDGRALALLEQALEATRSTTPG